MKDLITSIVSSLKNKYPKVKEIDNEIQVGRTGSTILFVPMGLPNDDTLTKIGISWYAMEDHIVKLISSDTRVMNWSKTNIEELAKCAKSFKDKAPLNKSKTILMTLGVTKEGLSVDDLITEIIKVSDNDVLIDSLGSNVVKVFTTG